jgi:adenylate cyclase, class 2
MGGFVVYYKLCHNYLMKDKEIEIQVQVEKIKPLIQFLKMNAKLVKKEHQIDEYYTPHHRDFIAVRPVAEWLRLRQENGKTTLTYKNWHYLKNGKSTHADEYETKVEDFNQMQSIFRALDFKIITHVDKKRQTYKYKDFEISLDCVKTLGDYIEIEYKGNDNKVDPQKITDQMIKLLKDLNVGKIYRNYVGYTFMVLFPDEKYKIEEL